MASPTIELPRLDGESARAYQARVEYVTAGPQRDLRTLARKLDKSLTLVGRWSSQYDWVKSAAEYDNQVAYLTVQEAADAHRADLADYRRRYGEVGKAMLGTAARMLAKLNRAVDGMEIGPGSLALIANAVKTAADLEALALRIEQALGDDEHSRE